ncbi:galactosyltransferase-related protein [Stenoxybacter acetivorans]|uniref:capsular polysaccharide export protein, LipB/KpsS family n=1 Tax=Stenoxybacter acetivorans TaxID=422441 RepID=UPI0024810082|nr:galactosyltransferase-related protein [Stenoxybacter acetivorans]
MTLRAHSEYDILSRLKLRAEYTLPDNFQFVIIDYGSQHDDAESIKRICDENGFPYHYVDSSSQIWNISKARNIGVLKSQADFIIIEDLDVFSCKDFYQKIKLQIDSLLINKNWKFFAIPVAYLSEQKSSTITALLDEPEYNDLISDIFDEFDSETIEFFAPTSSYLVCSRDLILSVGGYDESFEGWGLEDSDFALKLLTKANIEKPRDFYRLITKKYSEQVSWIGYRSLYRIFADICALKGIYGFHIWHPIRAERNDAIRKRNLSIATGNAEYYQNKKTEFIPLRDSDAESTLFLSLNPHSFNEGIFCLFKNPVYIEYSTISPDNIDGIIKEYKIKNIIFNNPYGNEQIKNLYTIFKKKGMDCYVVERGALPFSICIDKDGFCAESQSYQYDNWRDINIEGEKKEKTVEYINNFKLSVNSLEPQPDQIGGNGIKKRLNIGEKTKILFIALQSPSDTTTNYFCGKIGSYDNFINEIAKLPTILNGWRIIYKNHPLTIDKVVIEGAVCVDKYHINDILEASDAVTLINSGVGVLSVIYNKPVYFFGQVFYACNGLNNLVYDAEDLTDQLINNPIKFDENIAIKFISFLINDFYSFATWNRKERKYTDKANLSISENIRYDIVRVWDKDKKTKKEIFIDNSPIINLKQSILFDRYRLDDFIYNKNKTGNVNSTGNLNSLNYRSSAKNSSSIRRKLLKLKNNPYLFFYDFFRKKILKKDLQ